MTRNDLIALAVRDIEALDELRAATDNYLSLGLDGWVQPLDCGGYNGSDHSYRLSKLAKLGLADQRRRGGWSRGSKSYRISDAGRARLAALLRAYSETVEGCTE
jgi:hypothetical protein